MSDESEGKSPTTVFFEDTKTPKAGPATNIRTTAPKAGGPQSTTIPKSPNAPTTGQGGGSSSEPVKQPPPADRD